MDHEKNYRLSPIETIGLFALLGAPICMLFMTIPPAAHAVRRAVRFDLEVNFEALRYRL